MTPNPDYRKPNHGEITGMGIDATGMFLERWDDELQRVVRWRPSQDQPDSPSRPFNPEAFQGEWSR